MFYQCHRAPVMMEMLKKNKQNIKKYHWAWHGLTKQILVADAIIDNKFNIYFQAAIFSGGEDILKLPNGVYPSRHSGNKEPNASSSQ